MYFQTSPQSVCPRDWIVTLVTLVWLLECHLYITQTKPHLAKKHGLQYRLRMWINWIFHCDLKFDCWWWCGGRCCVWEVVNLGFEQDEGLGCISSWLNVQLTANRVTEDSNLQFTTSPNLSHTVNSKILKTSTTTKKAKSTLGHGRLLVYCWWSLSLSREKNEFPVYHLIGEVEEGTEEAVVIIIPLQTWKFKGKASPRNGCWTPLRSVNIPITTDSSCKRRSENK